jgi:hypothetical protein
MIRKDYGSEGHDRNDVYEVEVSIVTIRITIRNVGLLCLFCFIIWLHGNRSDMPQIDTVFQQVEEFLEANPEIRDKISSDLQTVTHSAIQRAAESDKGYCYIYPTPMHVAEELYETLSISKSMVTQAFQGAWGYPNGTKIIADPYYHVLLLLVNYGLRHNHRVLVKDAFFLILVNLWNGRMSKYLRYCDSEIMQSVILNMTKKMHLISHHETPYDLLHDHYVDGLLAKYGPEIETDFANGSKKILTKSWKRLNQVFMYKKKLKSGDIKLGGLFPLYLKAQEERTRVRPAVFDEAEESVSYGWKSLDQRIADYVAETSPAMDENTLVSLNSRTGVSAKVIATIVSSLREKPNYELVHEMTKVILIVTKAESFYDIARNFWNAVQEKILSSKRGHGAQTFRRLADVFLTQVLGPTVNKPYDSYGKVQRVQIRKVLIYVLAYHVIDLSRKQSGNTS